MPGCRLLCPLMLGFCNVSRCQADACWACCEEGQASWGRTRGYFNSSHGFCYLSVSDDFECMTDFEEGENPAVTPKTNRGSIVRFHYMWLAVQLSAVGSSETEETQRFGSTVAQREERSVNSPQHLSLFHYDALRLWAQAWGHENCQALSPKGRNHLWD